MNEPKLVSVFVPSLRGGGAERAMLIFAGELSRRGYRVDFVATKAAGPLVSLVPSGVRVVDLAQERTFRALPKLVDYIRRERPAVMFSSVMHVNVISCIATKLAGVETATIVRESNAPVSEPKRTLSRWLTFKLLPWTYPWAKGIIAVSSGVASELVSIRSKLESLVKVCPTPVVSDEMLELGDRPIDHPWFRAGEPPVVLAAARLQPHKGFSTLLRAFADLREERHLRLMILGEGPERARLEEEARNLGVSEDVALPGFVTNPFPFMRRASAFVLCSEYEGLPNVLIQALAFGTPCVATDCPSGPAEILLNGRFGSLVPVGSRAALKEGIADALRSGRRPDAAESMRERFGVEAAASMYLEVAGLPA